MVIKKFLAVAVAPILLVLTVLPVVAQKAPDSPKPHGGGATGPKLHRVAGVIKSISKEALVVTDDHKADTTLTLNATSTFEKLSAAQAKPENITAKEMSVGDSVVVHFVESDGKKIAKSVQISPPAGEKAPERKGSQTKSH